jgi:phosphoribosylformylglycinamidine synthase
VVLFPGSNCEQDMLEAVTIVGGEPEVLWHGDATVNGVDAVVVPGGFAHGDYLRPGAIARFSPVMAAVAEFAAAGGPVVGICNGFQVLTESHMLPGALMRNAALKFVCRPVGLEVEETQSGFTRHYEKGQRVTFPVAHGEGSYFADEETLNRLEGENRVAFRYAEGQNPNGSARNIAGILSEKRNVLGLMPHPERVVDEVLGGTDGRKLFQSLIEAIS